jgi:hypothetical protein
MTAGEWVIGIGIVSLCWLPYLVLSNYGKLSGTKLWWDVYLQELNNPVALNMDSGPRVQRARHLADETIKMLTMVQPGETMYGRIKN